MDVKKVALLVGALIVAGISAFFVNTLISGTPAPQAQAAPVEQGPEVLVATVALPVGTIIQPTAFRWQRWPAELVDPANYIIKGKANTEELVGTVVRNAITAGQPITQGVLVRPGDRGFLAAALGPGMRAVTVSVDGKAGVAGFVFPGDRVDLMLAQSVEGDGQPLKTAETVIRNLRVLATDQRSAPPDVAATKLEGEGQPDVRTFNLVTLEVTPRLAEKIAVAQSLGTLSLSLRSIADNQMELDNAIASGTVTLPPNATPADEARMIAQIAAQPADAGSSYVTGADVSRFARSTVPRQSSGSAPSGGGAALAAMGPAPAPVLSIDGSRAVGPAMAPVPRGPVVRVARGNTVTEVSVGGR